MKTETLHPLRILFRCALGALLIWAALGKLGNLQAFYNALLGYQLPLASPVLSAVAIGLPWMELLCGLMLFANFHAPAALAWTATLFALFSICSGQAWARGLPINCGCLNFSLFGIRQGSELGNLLDSAGFAFIRALVLTGVAAWLFRIDAVHPRSSKTTTDSSAANPTGNEARG